MAIKPYISSVVSKQLPEFVREDYQTFVSFLEAYYRYLDENYATRNLKELRNINETLERFVDYFKNEINCGLYFGFENCENLNKRLILQKLKQYYNAKGSEDALKFVMRLLYNTEPEIFYPGSLVLRASDGKWQQDISIFIEVSEGDIDDIVGKEIEIYDSSTEELKLHLFVERYVLVSGNVYEVFVQRYVGIISVSDTVSYGGSFSGTISGTTTGYQVLDGGSGFSVGQIFDVESAEGSGSKIKVTKVSSTGAIEKIQIVKFGSNFVTPFVSQLSSTSAIFTDPSPISVTKNSTLQFEVPSNSYTGGFVEEGFITEVGDYWGLTYADGSYVGAAITTFKNEWAAGTDTTNLASIRFTISAEIRYPGYYSSNDGFISDGIYIQDSFYYQAYSYVIKIEQLLENYKSVVKSFFHPAGMALFGEYGIENTFDMTTGIVIPENIIRLALTDSAAPTDSVAKSFTFDPFTDSFTVPDVVAKTLNKVTIANSGEIPGDSVTESDAGGVFLNSYAEGNYFASDYAAGDVAVQTF